MKTRKSLNRVWAYWFLATFLLPLHIGFSVWVSQSVQGNTYTWFTVASGFYALLHGLGVTSTGIMLVMSDNCRILVEKPETLKEKRLRLEEERERRLLDREQRLLDEEFPG